LTAFFRVDHVSQLQSKLHHAQLELVEQETEANNAINLWQDSCSQSEDRCSELEEKLQNATERLQKMSNDLNTLGEKATSLEEENASFRARSLDRQAAPSDPQDSNDAPFGDRQDSAIIIAGLEDALRISQKDLSLSDDLVHQWEGKRASKYFGVHEVV
jgi:chromosome segregation ATPase